MIGEILGIIILLMFLPMIMNLLNQFTSQFQQQKLQLEQGGGGYNKSSANSVVVIPQETITPSPPDKIKSVISPEAQKFIYTYTGATVPSTTPAPQTPLELTPEVIGRYLLNKNKAYWGRPR